MRDLSQLEWQKFWMLTVIKHLWVIKWHRYYSCVCDCWNEKDICAESLFENTQSCWCLRKKLAKELWFKNKEHWLSNTKIYNVFRWLNRRCYEKTNKDYYSYWWRWIICEWESFEEFYEDMWSTYRNWLTLDRIDNNWNYSKSNCKRETPLNQWKNKRNNYELICWLSLKNYCKVNNISYNAVWKRIKLQWMSQFMALSKPIRYRNDKK